MTNISDLQARHKRKCAEHGIRSDPAQKAWRKLNRALHAELAAKPVHRVQAVTERRV